jgi:hypothetical protein
MRTLAERKLTQRSNSRIQDAAVGKTGASASKLTGTPGTSELQSSSSFAKTNKTGLTQKRRASSRPKTPPPIREDSRDYEPAVYRRTHITPPKKRNSGFLSAVFNFLGALFFLTVAVGILWRVFDVRGFRKTFVPALPQPVQQFVKSIDPK